MNDGYWTLPTRITLPQQQRERLERLCRQRQLDIDELLSEIVLQYLDEIPESALAEPLPEPYQPTLQEQLRHHERELRRLKIRQNQLGTAAPHWLSSYMDDIQKEIQIVKDKLDQQT